MTPLLDAHVHCWDPRRLAYPWLAALPALDRPLLPADYRAATSAEVGAFVLVTAGGADPAAEVELALELADADADAGGEPRVAAIVADAPLDDEDDAGFLELLAAEPLVRGVRRQLAFEPDPHRCLAPAALRTTRRLAALDLALDLRVTPALLGAARELAARCPEVPIVLDHLGNPDVRGRGLDPWRGDLARLAALPNVWCKLSGLVTDADRGAWTAGDLAPFLRHAIACFGPARLMIGSDWPIVLQAATIGAWLAALDAVLAELGPDDQARIRWRTGRAFYRIEPTRSREVPDA